MEQNQTLNAATPTSMEPSCLKWEPGLNDTKRLAASPTSAQPPTPRTCARSATTSFAEPSGYSELASSLTGNGQTSVAQADSPGFHPAPQLPLMSLYFANIILRASFVCDHFRI
jgi:hypothetical protein